MNLSFFCIVIMKISFSFPGRIPIVLWIATQIEIVRLLAYFTTIYIRILVFELDLRWPMKLYVALVSIITIAQNIYGLVQSVGILPAIRATNFAPIVGTICGCIVAWTIAWDQTVGREVECVEIVALVQAVGARVVCQLLSLHLAAGVGSLDRYFVGERLAKHWSFR